MSKFITRFKNVCTQMECGSSVEAAYTIKDLLETCGSGMFEAVKIRVYSLSENRHYEYFIPINPVNQMNPDGQ